MPHTGKKNGPIVGGICTPRMRATSSRGAKLIAELITIKHVPLLDEAELRQNTVNVDDRYDHRKFLMLLI